MRPDGVTQVGARPSGSIGSAFDVMPDGTDLGQGRVMIATENPADWQPGMRFANNLISTQLIEVASYVLTRSRFRVEILTS